MFIRINIFVNTITKLFLLLLYIYKSNRLVLKKLFNQKFVLLKLFMFHYTINFICFEVAYLCIFELFFWKCYIYIILYLKDYKRSM